MKTNAIVATTAVVVGSYTLYTRRFASSAKAETSAGTPTFASMGFHSLKLASSDPVNHNVKRLRFELPSHETTSGLPLTSALLAITFPKGCWLPVLRPYTPVTDRDTPGYIEFLIKLYPGGKQSTHMHSLQPGDAVTFFRIPSYTWTPNEQAHIGLVAGGQGITPCYQLLRGILCNPQDTTRISLVWGVNSDADLLLLDELAALQRGFPGRLDVRYIVSNPTADSPHPRGRVTAEILKEAGIVHAGPDIPGVSKVFLSGPPPMEKAFKEKNGVLTQVGFKNSDVHTF